jgi:putative glutathione S-transferase
MPEIQASVDFYHIQTHYFSSHPHLNPYAIIPGRELTDYSMPHDRARLAA